MEINIVKKDLYKVVEMKGRIDGLSSSDIEKELSLLTSEGERTLVINFAEVNYISSAGLRIFLSTQKTLKKIGGELLLISLQPQTLEVFRISGFSSIFRIFNNEEEYTKTLIEPEAESELINGIKYFIKKFPSLKGNLFTIGSQDKLQENLYAEKDVIDVNASSIQYGTGMAVLGDSFDEYKNLFGETVIIKNNFYSYPAIKKSAVDFMLKEQINPELNFKFLYGFGFNGDYSSILMFSEQDEYPSLNELVSAAKTYSGTNVFGVILLAESAGIYSMNLKKTPITENKPLESGIFSHANFADWIDFSLEASNTNNIIAGTGIVVIDKSSLQENYKSIFSEDSDFHIHCGIFEKKLLSKNISSFEEELNRTLNKFEVYKVQHLLGKSKFKCGMLAIVELEEC